MSKIDLKDLDNMKLIFLVQDINREGGENKYTEEFIKAVNKEVGKRGKKL